MIIKNFTPHDINIIAKESCEYVPEIRKYVLKDPKPRIIRTIPSSGMLSAQMEEKVELEIEGIEISVRKVISCDPIPEGDIIIVSALYANACRIAGLDTTRLFIIKDPVYDAENGLKIVGCLGLSVPF